MHMHTAAVTHIPDSKPCRVRCSGTVLRAALRWCEHVASKLRRAAVGGPTCAVSTPTSDGTRGTCTCGALALVGAADGLVRDLCDVIEGEHRHRTAASDGDGSGEGASNSDSDDGGGGGPTRRRGLAAVPSRVRSEIVRTSLAIIHVLAAPVASFVNRDPVAAHGAPNATDGGGGGAHVDARMPAAAASVLQRLCMLSKAVWQFTPTTLVSRATVNGAARHLHAVVEACLNSAVSAGVHHANANVNANTHANATSSRTPPEVVPLLRTSLSLVHTATLKRKRAPASASASTPTTPTTAAATVHHRAGRHQEVGSVTRRRRAQNQRRLRGGPRKRSSDPFIDAHLADEDGTDDFSDLVGFVVME